MQSQPPIDPMAPTAQAPQVPVTGYAALIAPSPRPAWPIAAAALGVGFGLGVLVGLFAAGGNNDAAASHAAEAIEGSGELAVSSEPAGGVVLIDGRVVGLTPVPRLELAPGDHSIAIDLFGYQPYLGTLTIEAGGKAGLDAHLAALNDASGARTRGDLRGSGKVVARPVPRSALVGAAPAAAAPAPAANNKGKRSRRSPPARPEPPRRDCSGEERTCTRACDRAMTDCDFGCPGCSSCLTTVGWDECRRQCDSCRQGCKSNLTFCKSRCESDRRQCRG
jgi:hypothetical protein